MPRNRNRRNRDTHHLNRGGRNRDTHYFGQEAAESGHPSFGLPLRNRDTHHLACRIGMQNRDTHYFGGGIGRAESGHPLFRVAKGCIRLEHDGCSNRRLRNIVGVPICLICFRGCPDLFPDLFRGCPDLFPVLGVPICFQPVVDVPICYDGGCPNLSDSKNMMGVPDFCFVGVPDCFPRLFSGTRIASYLLHSVTFDALRDGFPRMSNLAFGSRSLRGAKRRFAGPIRNSTRISLWKALPCIEYLSWRIPCVFPIDDRSLAFWRCSQSVSVPSRAP
ncbi:hypothetical protein SCOR_30525 [Sulfidibacter corallicola]